jgi:hypothetical protein
MTPCFHWGTKATTLWLTVCYGALLYSSLCESCRSTILQIAIQVAPSHDGAIPVVRDSALRCNAADAFKYPDQNLPSRRSNLLCVHRE